MERRPAQDVRIPLRNLALLDSGEQIALPDIVLIQNTSRSPLR